MNDINQGALEAQTFAAKTGAAGWLLILWLAVTCYNVFKPYHIDDTAHLEIARWIVGNPLHPMSGILNWQGIAEPIYRTNQPHLYFYLLALWGSVFGFSEFAMHSLQSLFALACIVLFYRMACSFAPRAALWSTVLLVLSPAFVVEQNLMVDVPLLALWLLFFTPILLHSDSQHQTGRYLVAGLACSAALLIKYSSLVLLPVLIVSMLLERRRSQAWIVAVPLAVLACWSAFNWFDYGGFHIATRMSGEADSFRPLKNAVAWVVCLGGITPLGVIACMEMGSLKAWASAVYSLISVAFFTLCACVAIGLVSGYRSDEVLWAAFLLNGLLLTVALIFIAYNVVRHQIWQPATRDRSFRYLILITWILATTAFYILFAPFVAPRHVLLIMPPIILLLIGNWGKTLSSSSKVFALIFTVVVSAGLGISDWRFAAFYRSEAALIAHDHDQSPTTWASGHWGWQWYAALNGLRIVDVEKSALAPGDRLIVPEDVDHQAFKVQPKLALLRTDIQDRALLNLLCTGRPARFYAFDFKNTPWTVSRECVGRINVYKVEPE